MDDSLKDKVEGKAHEVKGAVKEKISPYWVPGDPKSGVLPRISTAPPGAYGAADNKLQAYCFRLCLTDTPANRVPFPKPVGYDPKQYELLLRVFQAGWRETFVVSAASLRSKRSTLGGLAFRVARVSRERAMIRSVTLATVGCSGIRRSSRS